jgi:nicotinamidase-related amidase
MSLASGKSGDTRDPRYSTTGAVHVRAGEGPTTWFAGDTYTIKAWTCSPRSADTQDHRRSWRAPGKWPNCWRKLSLIADPGDDSLMSRTIDVPPYRLHEEVRVDPTQTALVVVDMQNDFVREGGSLRVPDAEATIPAISGLLDLARAHGMRVVYSQDTHRDGDPEWQIWPEHAREGGWGWQLVAELAPAEDETVLRKVRYDAFYGTPLDHLLRVWGVNTLVICGTVANICVHYTAASAALRWYNVVIPRDAISALEPFDLEASLRQTDFLFAGRVTTAGAVRI